MTIKDNHVALTPKDIVNGLSIGELENTDASPFWWTKGGRETGADGQPDWGTRYKHEAGKAGDIFYDANNGDRWKVIAISREYHRAVVTNLSQHGSKLVYWN